MKVGLTEKHGMSLEQSKFPPEQINYQFLDYKTNGAWLYKSPLKGFMSKFYDEDCDLLEAILTPARTNRPWVYSLACYEEALAFSFAGIPTPRAIRAKWMERIFSKDNFKGLLFWSNAGLDTMYSYGGMTNKKIIDKSYVVYPAIRQPSSENIRFTSGQTIQLLFNGNFFIKGGANVVDTFENLQKTYPNIRLRLCCDINIDFHTDNSEMRERYLNKILNNPSIILGRVTREQFISEILPNTDIYLLPTYGDAFGFAILEAMAHGIPVVSTNYMAIPEMIDSSVDGYLINTKKYDMQSMFKGCYVKHLPEQFRKDINEMLLQYIIPLIENPQLRKDIGFSAIDKVNRKFSFSVRQSRMNEIYSNIDL